MLDIINKFSHLSRETLFKILENIYNEVYVVDKNSKVIYINSACVRHYGLTPSEMIGKPHNDLVSGRWYPSVIPQVFKEKCIKTLEQVSHTGVKMISTAVPVVDNDGEIEMIVTIVQQQFNKLDVEFNIENKDLAVLEADVENDDLKSSEEIITKSPLMISLIKSAKKCAKTEMPIFINGATGTGKSTLAKYIHEISRRKEYPFLIINCAAIHENLLESELFGYEPHAFTGASPKGKIGLVEAADKGTLFLDEIGELSPNLQAKLLNVIENKQFIPVGGKKVKNVDIRIISATNQDLEKLVEEKKFREDLYWRINTMDIKLLSLNERREDIIPLATYFLDSFNKKYDVKKDFSREVESMFENYDWPGNIRQLKNIVERSVIVSMENTIRSVDISEIISKETNKCNMISFRNYEKALESFERKVVKEAFEKYGSSRRMSKEMNISQSKASRLIRKYCE